MITSRSARSVLRLAALGCAVRLFAACVDAKDREPVPVLDVLQVLPLAATIEVGETASLGALRLRGGETTNVTGEVEWESDDESVVTVSYDAETGAVATAVALGTARITATDDDGSASAEITVTAGVAAIELDRGLFEVAIGTERKLGAIALTTDGAKRPFDDGLWGSSDSAVATVDASGIVSGVAGGEADITLTREGVAVSQRVAVRDVALEAIEVAVVGGRTLPFGQSSVIQVTGTFAGGYTQPVTSLFELEVDGDVVTIDDTAVVAGVEEGTATVTVTGREGSAVADMSVDLDFEVRDAPLESLELELPAVLPTEGDGAVATVTATYAGGLTFPADATLSAEPAELVSIDNAAGTVTGRSPGTVEITASVVAEDGDGDPETGDTIETTREIEVVDSEVTELAVELATEDVTATFAMGGKTQLLAAARFGESEPVDVTELAVWSSDAVSIAVVSNVGSGRVTGVAPGSATITATYRGETASFMVTVTP